MSVLRPAGCTVGTMANVKELKKLRIAFEHYVDISNHAIKIAVTGEPIPAHVGKNRRRTAHNVKHILKVLEAEAGKDQGSTQDE